MDEYLMDEYLIDELTQWTATELAEGIRKGEVTSVEVVEAHVERIERWNPVINAVVTLDAERALDRAKAADAALEAGQVWGPLHGVPMTVKDQFATARIRTTFGLVECRNHVPTSDAPLVARLHRAGAVLLGKTNLPTAAYDWQSNNPTFGRTNNPWDVARTPGGSSGGSAAALAAGFAPLELGADVGGSIRLPAHFCGVYGLRPTEGALPFDGVTPPGRPRTVRHIVVAGPMARSVEDLQRAWDVLRTPTGEPLPPATNGAEATVRLSDLTVRVTPAFADAPPTAATERVVTSVGEALADAGAEVRRTRPPVDVETALRTWGKVQGYELTAGLPQPLRSLPLKTLVWQGVVRAFYGYLASYLSRGAHLGAKGYFAALEEKEALSRRLDATLTDADLWVTPVAGVPAFRHCRTGAALPVDAQTQPYAKPLATYLCTTAVTGHPVLTVPAGRTDDGLPIGVQVHARRGRDAWLLRVGRRLADVMDVGAPVWEPTATA